MEKIDFGDFGRHERGQPHADANSTVARVGSCFDSFQDKRQGQKHVGAILQCEESSSSRAQLYMDLSK